MTIVKSVLATLTYSDYFSFPLTLSELHSRLIFSKPVSRPQLSRALKSLLTSHQVARSGVFYYLPGKSSLIAKRLRRQKLALPLVARARFLASKISYLPGILAIFLTGSLAMSNSGQNSDIDFLVITKPGRLWTTRFLLTLYTSLLGLRRTPTSTHNAGKLCLNLYLTPNSLALPPGKRTLYTAYELIQALPLYDPFDTRLRLLSANPWIRDFLPNYSIHKRSSSLPIIHNSLFIILLERLIYRLQLLYMQRKITRELVTPDMAFFHPRNPGKAALKRLKKI